MNGSDDSSERVCSCGFNRTHHRVSVEPEYAVGAWALLILGISASPRRLVYRCRLCEEVIEQTTDPVALKAHY